ncbi:MAG: VanZ family protein [Flavobacteriaceae bacterium]
MLKRIKTLLEDKAIFIAISITIFIAILSLIKTDNILLGSFSNSDKVYHAIAYFFLMLSWLYTFHKKEAFNKNVKYAILACFIYGIIIEVLQGVTTTYRTASYLDMLANGSGVVLAVLAFHLFEKKIQLI